MDKPPRVGFTLIGGEHWTGGYNYLLNLLRAVKTYGKGRVVPVLFVGDDVSEDFLRPFASLLDRPIVRSAAFSRKRVMSRSINSLFLGKDANAEKVFLSQHIDAVVESATYYGWRFSIPAIAWIPDLQHRHLPGMFGFRHYWRREIGIQCHLRSKRTIMVSSKSAMNDLKRFYPVKHCADIRVVPFAVMVEEFVEGQNPSEIRDYYGLPEHYFFLPNQFFKHKNHALVIRALEILGNRSDSITVAASGSQADPRHPGYFHQIKSMVHNKELDHCFRFLGVIPYDHLIALMRCSLAVLNPSLFEGWSTTVEEAKALGVPLLLSDIPVLREQVEKDVYFFDPRDPRALAEGLGMLREKLAGRRHDEKGAEVITRKRVKGFVERFIEVVSPDA